MLYIPYTYYTCSCSCAIYTLYMYSCAVYTLQDLDASYELEEVLTNRAPTSNTLMLGREALVCQPCGKGASSIYIHGKHLVKPQIRTLVISPLMLCKV